MIRHRRVRVAFPGIEASAEVAHVMLLREPFIRGPNWKSEFRVMSAHGSIDWPAVLGSPLLLFGPGPSNVSPRVMEAASLPPLTPSNKTFLAYLRETQGLMKSAFRTSNVWTFAVSGAAHAAMEMGVCSTLEPGDRALVALHGGLWGHRVAEMCARHGARVKTISVPVGEVFSDRQIEEAIAEFRPKLFFTCHGESTTGVLQPIRTLGSLCHEYGCLLMVDAVATLGACPLFTDDWQIDVVYSGAQKALSALPGVSLISFSQRAMAAVLERKTPIGCFYLDAKLVGSYWGCDDVPFTTAKYHHTPPANLVYALREALLLFLERTPEAVWREHRENSDELCRGLEQLGLEVVVKDPEVRLPSVTVIGVPDDIDCNAFCEHLLQRHRMEIKSGLGPTRGRVWRIGLMGYNSTAENVRLVLDIVHRALRHFRPG